MKQRGYGDYTYTGKKASHTHTHNAPTSLAFHIPPKLEPGARKGAQNTRTNFLVFTVTRGRVEVTIHETTTTVGTGTCFYVPPSKWAADSMTAVLGGPPGSYTSPLRPYRPVDNT
jgi:mannose-6-phosphate isomerase-like protein (cupin superfamily)